MAQQGGEVFERIDPVQLCGVNQAHEDIAGLRAVERLVEQRVFTVYDRPLKGIAAKLTLEQFLGTGYQVV